MDQEKARDRWRSTVAWREANGADTCLERPHLDFWIIKHFFPQVSGWGGILLRLPVTSHYLPLPPITSPLLLASLAGIEMLQTCTQQNVPAAFRGLPPSSTLYNPSKIPTTVPPVLPRPRQAGPPGHILAAGQRADARAQKARLVGEYHPPPPTPSPTTPTNPRYPSPPHLQACASPSSPCTTCTSRSTHACSRRSSTSRTTR